MMKKSEQAYGDGDDSDDSEAEDVKAVRGGTAALNEKNTLFTSNGSGIPLRRRAGYNYPPTWLRSNSQIYKSPPQVNIDSLSLHILDYGYGAHALLTVRQIDAERQKKLTLEQQSRAGILGRIISGVWVKLADVVMGGRSAGIAGEISDSPAALMTFLLMLIHSFSMNSVASIDYWLNVLEKEIKDIVVSKHSSHLTEVERLIKGEIFFHRSAGVFFEFYMHLLSHLLDFYAYLDPFENILLSLSKEQEESMLHLDGNSSEDDDDHHEAARSRLHRFSGLVKSSSSKTSLSKNHDYTHAVPFSFS